MKERVQGIVAGVLIGALVTGGGVLAKNAAETITVEYANIKVYKDNVLCELKDSNGKVIEPFIYNGTTYMPVRGTASIADMDVTWDGATKSVYLWDESTPDGTFLMDVCPPYETAYCEQYLPSDYQSEGKSFQMGGTKYANGFILCKNHCFYKGDQAKGYALFNLNGKYKNIQMTIGHVDDTDMTDAAVRFYLDGKLYKEMDIVADELPTSISLPVEYALQLKISVSCSDGYCGRYGFGNITVE